MPTERVIDENELAIAILDKYAATDGHTLIIPRRHISDYFHLYVPERNAIEDLLGRRREALQGADKTIDGFNIGVNAGASAGQTVFHVHCHLIPRRTGDMGNPEGGVRGVIPAKQGY